MTNPDTAPLTWAYFFAATGFAASLILVPLAVIAVHRYVMTTLRRHIENARRYEWPDPGFEDDWRVESSNVVPLQRVSR